MIYFLPAETINPFKKELILILEQFVFIYQRSIIEEKIKLTRYFYLVNFCLNAQLHNILLRFINIFRYIFSLSNYWRVVTDGQT